MGGVERPYGKLSEAYSESPGEKILRALGT